MTFWLVTPGVSQPQRHAQRCGHVWQAWRVHPLSSTLLCLAAAGAGTIAYGTGYERTAFALRRVEIPVLPGGSTPVTVLHISDAHMLPGQTKKQRWLRQLVDLDPDLVINTGDNLAHADAVPAVLRAYGDLLDLPGVFVPGSNDYYSPTFKNPARYLIGPSDGHRWRRQDMPWRELRDAFVGRGWRDLTNRRESLTVRGAALSFVGVDDPHLGYDDLQAVAGPADPAADLAIGVAHAPYLRILDSWNAQGYPLIFAGHTHGGQLCVPGFGAVVTNCDLDRSRAKGLHRHRTPGHDPSWLHVSAGLGTSPFAPVRFACPPEATLLTLVPRPTAATPARTTPASAPMDIG